MTAQEFVKMLASGEEPPVIEGTETKLGDGVYRVGERQYRVNTHEPGGLDYIVGFRATGLYGSTSNSDLARSVANRRLQADGCNRCPGRLGAWRLDSARAKPGD